MFFSDYSEFLEPDKETSSFTPKLSTGSYIDNTQYLAAQVMDLHHDLVYSEFTEVISKRLIRQPYPLHFKNCNPFCPLCLKLVRNEDIFTTCFISNDRNYLIHTNCLESDKSYQMRSIGEVL